MTECAIVVDDDVEVDVVSTTQPIDVQTWRQRTTSNSSYLNASPTPYSTGLDLSEQEDIVDPLTQLAIIATGPQSPLLHNNQTLTDYQRLVISPYLPHMMLAVQNLLFFVFETEALYLGRYVVELHRVSMHPYTHMLNHHHITPDPLLLSQERDLYHSLVLKANTPHQVVTG